VTLVARILIGAPPEEPTIPFPAPRHRVGPLNLGRAATLLLNEDHTVNRREIYRRIGFDARTAQRLMIEPRPGETEERTRTKRSMLLSTKGIGLELIAGMMLSCLDSPQTPLCACRVGKDGKVPYGPAPGLNPDVRADYEGFTVIAEVTTMRELTPERIESQYESAKSHVELALGKKDLKRVYCIMVNRADLNDKDTRRRLVDAEEKFADGPASVKFLAFAIQEFGHIGRKLHEFYCMDREDVWTLTEGKLRAILDTLHAEAMKTIGAEDEFEPGWAGRFFGELLEEAATAEEMPQLPGV